MGEAKCKALVDEVTKRLVDDGKLIEAGWQSLRVMAISPNAPEVQLREMRMAFFAGAQHVFGSMMSMLDEDKEPTEADIKRMDSIHAELEEFITQFKLRIAPSQGSG